MADDLHTLLLAVRSAATAVGRRRAESKLYEAAVKHLENKGKTFPGVSDHVLEDAAHETTRKLMGREGEGLSLTHGAASVADWLSTTFRNEVLTALRLRHIPVEEDTLTKRLDGATAEAPPAHETAAEKALAERDYARKRAELQGLRDRILPRVERYLRYSLAPRDADNHFTRIRMAVRRCDGVATEVLLVEQHYLTRAELGEGAKRRKAEVLLGQHLSRARSRLREVVTALVATGALDAAEAHRFLGYYTAGRRKGGRKPRGEGS